MKKCRKRNFSIKRCINILTIVMNFISMVLFQVNSRKDLFFYHIVTIGHIRKSRYLSEMMSYHKNPIVAYVSMWFILYVYLRNDYC
jgi:hypothetical protein